MNKQGDWWESFFSGMCLDFVQSSRSEEQTRSEMGFIQRALGLPTRAKVLDVPCGGGRLSLELASFGYQVTGIDQSPQLLDAAARSATERGLLVDWQQRDMRDLPWDAKFDGAICFWSSFGYFDEEGNAEFLRSVSRSLKPGARFIFDTPLIETRLAEVLDEPRVWQEVGDLLALEERGLRLRDEPGRVVVDLHPRWGKGTQTAIDAALYLPGTRGSAGTRGIRKPPGLRECGLRTVRTWRPLALPGNNQGGHVTTRVDTAAPPPHLEPWWVNTPAAG